jgi:ADP-ribose pyrophosphatase
MMSSAGDEHLKETLVSAEAVWRGRFLDVRRDTVALPDGAHTTREYIVHPGAVMMVPLLPDGRLVMERQYRYPMGRVMLEFPAGKIDAGEAPFACAVRELAEETGYRAAQWARAGILPGGLMALCARAIVRALAT